MKKTLIILIPGNPSIPGVYEPFLDQVVNELNLAGQVVSHILPHLGQCNQQAVKRRTISVHDVIADHKQKVFNLIQREKSDQIFLIGHSLGSAITINLYQHFETCVDKFIILCPFLGPTKNNKAYLKLFKNPLSRLGIKGISYSILKNKRISNRFFNFWLGDTPFNQLIPNEIQKPLYLKNFFSLVGSYISDFDNLDMQRKLESMCPKKSFFLFAPKDYWVPDEIVHLLPPRARFQRCMNISHDFCLKKEQYQEVAKIIAEESIR